MPINGRVQCIDFCIHQIVAALNAGGIRTLSRNADRGALSMRASINRLLKPSQLGYDWI